MAEPVSSSYATGSLLIVAFLSLFPGADAAVLLGALSGAIVFVTTATDGSALKKIGFFIISFIAGCLGAAMTTGILESLLPSRVAVSHGIGAMLTAALAVRILLWLINQVENPGGLLALLRGDRS